MKICSIFVFVRPQQSASSGKTNRTPPALNPGTVPLTGANTGQKNLALELLLRASLDLWLIGKLGRIVALLKM